MRHALVPRLDRYAILQLEPDRALVDVAPDSHVLRSVTAADIPAVERARPGYGGMVREYLRSGHHGQILEIDGQVAAMGWYFVNTADSTRRVKGYHPLPRGRALLHADWTNANHRGRGLHKVLVSSRVAEVWSLHPATVVEAAILPSNRPSMHNYAKLGFERQGDLNVLSWWRWSVGRRRE